MIKINHIAIVVGDLEGAKRFWVDALGLPLAREEVVAAEGVAAAFLPAGEQAIELLQPLDGESGVARFLDKRGPGMHHVCLDVADLDGAVERLRAHDIELINETPRTGSDGRRYAFVHPRSTGGVLLELYEVLDAKG